MANEVQIDIELEVNRANRSLQQISSSFDKFAKNAKTSIGTVDIAIGSLAANIAGAAIQRGFAALSSGVSKLNEAAGKAISLAQVQEDAINRLNVQLQITGNFTKETSAELQAFASSLQKVTTAGDEAILNQLAFAQAMGASVDQSKDIVKAALDMSAALGIDLEAATRNISKTLGGYAGELGEVIPELKNLTQEQLRAGEGVKLLTDRFAGAATGRVKTFSGALAQLNNTQGDFLERVGEIVTKNPVVIAAVNGLNKVFLFLQDFVKNNQQAFQDFINKGINFLIEGIKPAGEAIILFNKILDGLNNFVNFTAELFLASAQTFYEYARAAVAAAVAVKEFLGLDSSGLKATEESLKRQIEIFQQARIANDKEVSDRLATQEAFNESLREITGRTVDIIKEEILARQEVTEAAALETQNKIAAKQQEFDLLQALREEQKARLDEEKAARKELAALEQEEDFTALTENLSEKERLQLVHETNLLKQQGKTNEARKKLRDAAIKNEQSGIASLFSFEKNTNASRAENFKSTLGTISTLSQSSNKQLFAIGKAAAISTSIIDGIAAVQKALKSAPPPFNFAIAAVVGAATAANTAKIASQQPPAFQNGGIVPGENFNGDKVLARVNSGELILNQAQQDNIAGQLGGSGFAAALEKIASQPIIVEIDGQEIARATRNAVRDGFKIA